MVDTFNLLKIQLFNVKFPPAWYTQAPFALKLIFWKIIFFKTTLHPFEISKTLEKGVNLAVTSLFACSIKKFCFLCLQAEKGGYI